MRVLGLSRHEFAAVLLGASGVLALAFIVGGRLGDHLLWSGPIMVAALVAVRQALVRKERLLSCAGSGVVALIVGLAVSFFVYFLVGFYRDISNYSFF